MHTPRQCLRCREISYRHDLRRQILLQEALDSNVRVAPGPFEDLPKAANAYSGPQRELICFNLPLCAVLCMQTFTSAPVTGIPAHTANACSGPV